MNVLQFRQPPRTTRQPLPAGQALGIVSATPSPIATPAPVASAAPAPVATVPEPDPAAAFCPSLPSSETANAVLDGEPGSLVLLGRDLAVRGALVTTGVYLVDRFFYGERDVKRSFARGLGGAAAIEVFVLMWMTYKKWHHRHVNGQIVYPGPAPV